MAENELFQKLLRSLLLKDQREFDEAITSAAQMNISMRGLERIMEKIHLWIRMKGLMPLKEKEQTALVKLQAFFRYRYVQKKMMERYNLYCRLSMIDCEDYAIIAHKYHRLLKL